MSPEEALDRIAALCDRHEVGDPVWTRFTADGDAEYFHVVPTDGVRAVLAEVSPEPGGVPEEQAPALGRWTPGRSQQEPAGHGTPDGKRAREEMPAFPLNPRPGGVFDRDQARAVLRKAYREAWQDSDILDALAGCVRPAAIDRDALRAAIAGPVQGLGDEPWEAERDEAIDAATQAVLVLVGAAS